jgi:hypothetical protein
MMEVKKAIDGCAYVQQLTLLTAHVLIARSLAFIMSGLNLFCSRKIPLYLIRPRKTCGLLCPDKSLLDHENQSIFTSQVALI